jgi:hypothetical protein
MTTYPQKITFGEMRSSGVHDVLVYCRDHKKLFDLEKLSGQRRQSVTAANAAS